MTLPFCLLIQPEHTGLSNSLPRGTGGFVTLHLFCLMSHLCLVSGKDEVHHNYIPVSKEKERKRNMHYTSFKGVTCNRHTPLLLPFHCQELGHKDMASFKGNWEIESPDERQGAQT